MKSQTSEYLSQNLIITNFGQEDLALHKLRSIVALHNKNVASYEWLRYLGIKIVYTTVYSY